MFPKRSLQHCQEQMIRANDSDVTWASIMLGTPEWEEKWETPFELFPKFSPLETLSGWYLFSFYFNSKLNKEHVEENLTNTSLHARTLWEHCQKSTTMIPIDIGKGFLLLDDGNHFYVVHDCDLTIIHSAFLPVDLVLHKNVNLYSLC